MTKTKFTTNEYLAEIMLRAVFVWLVALTMVDYYIPNLPFWPHIATLLHLCGS